MTTPTATTGRRSRASRGADKTAASKPAQTAAQLNAATEDQLAARRAAQTAQASTGTKVTGDNRKPSTAASKPTATKPTAPATDQAAKPVKVTAAKKPEGPTPTEQKRIVANAMAKAVADMLAKWDAAKTGVPAEFAAQTAAGYLNYAPVTEWDTRLPDRSGAGGRGAKNRAS